MPVQGFVRLRKHQFGRQTVFGTKVAATRAYPFSGVPSNELNWTDPEVDAGSIALTTPPYRAAPDLTASLTAPSLYYNDMPLMFSGIFGGSEFPATVATTGRRWEWAPSVVDPLDEPDAATYEFGDDVTTDWFQLGDGVLETLEITGPEGLGALTASMGWRFGSIASSGSTDSPDVPTVPTAGLSVDTEAIVVYLKDGAIYISSDDDTLAANQISDALHTFTLRITKTRDQKRWANGDQSFDIDAYGDTSLAIELECTFAKTTDTVGLGSESDAWLSDDAVTRYVRMIFTSTSEVAAGEPYLWNFTMPMRYYTRTEGEVGGNTVIVLTGRAFLEPVDFGGFFTTRVMNTLDDTALGSLTS